MPKHLRPVCVGEYGILPRITISIWERSKIISRDHVYKNNCKINANSRLIESFFLKLAWYYE